MVKKLWLSIWLVCACLVGMPCQGWAANRELTLGLFENSPYMSESLPANGVLAEMVSEAFRRQGITVHYQIYPLRRLYHLVATGEIDGAVGVPFAADRTRNFVFSAPLVKVNYNFFARKQDHLQVGRLAELKGLRIGVVRGGLNEQTLLAQGLKVDAVSNHEQNIRKLLAGRIDLLVSVSEYTQYLLNHHFSEAERDQLEKLEPPFAVRAKHLVMSKKRAELSRLLPGFNRTLEKMKHDGTLAEIFRRHNVKL